MDNQPKTLETTPSRAILFAQEKFTRVRVRFGDEEFECSLKTALFELKRREMTLLDVAVVDFGQASAGAARSRQCQAIYDAVFSAGLRDPILEDAKARRTLEHRVNEGESSRGLAG